MSESVCPGIFSWLCQGARSEPPGLAHTCKKINRKTCQQRTLLDDLCPNVKDKLNFFKCLFNIGNRCPASQKDAKARSQKTSATTETDSSSTTGSNEASEASNEPTRRRRKDFCSRRNEPRRVKAETGSKLSTSETQETGSGRGCSSAVNPTAATAAVFQRQRGRLRGAHPGNTKGGSTAVLLTSGLTGFD
jgi:hypothetical protein